jgi:crossover junction endodeoxyribonuclease RusA
VSVITLTLPYPVSVNAYWLASGKRRYISKRGVEFKKCVKEIWEASNHQGFGSAKVEFNVLLFPRDNRLMDIDNMLKCLGDSLQDAGAFEDDQQVWKITIERGEKIKGGGCQVTISEYPNVPIF